MKTLVDYSKDDLLEMAERLRKDGLIAIMDWGEEGTISTKPLMELVAQCLEYAANNR